MKRQWYRSVDLFGYAHKLVKKATNGFV